MPEPKQNLIYLLMLFCSHILNMIRSPLHTRSEVSGILLSVLAYVHMYPEICEIAIFFTSLRIRLASTRVQRIFGPYPEFFENALQAGNNFFYLIRIRIRVDGRICKFANMLTSFSWIQSSQQAL